MTIWKEQFKHHFTGWQDGILIGAARDNQDGTFNWCGWPSHITGSGSSPSLAEAKISTETAAEKGASAPAKFRDKWGMNIDELLLWRKEVGIDP